jgi:hypothetical protein
MTKKERSPQRNIDSPNPRPKRRNKKQREGMKNRSAASKSPPPSPAPSDTPNTYSVLQSDSEDDTASDGFTTPRTDSGNDLGEPLHLNRVPRLQ